MKVKKDVCKRCKGAGVIEVFNKDVGFEVYEPCPGCDKDIKHSLKGVYYAI